MKKMTKIYLTMLVALVLAVATACSSDKKDKDDNGAVTEPDTNVEQPTDNDTDGKDKGDKEEPANNEEKPNEPELEEAEPTEQDQKIVDDMKKEEGVENAVAYVTDDGYVLTTFEVEESMTEDKAKTLAEQYSEKLAKEYPDHVIDIEVKQGENLLTTLTVEPKK